MPVAGSSFGTRIDCVAGYDSLLGVLSRHERHIIPRQRTPSSAKGGVQLSTLRGGKSWSSSPSAFGSLVGRKQDLKSTIVANATSSPAGTVKDLPIFPLQGVVAFPAVSCPLLIFEARYRVLFNTLLSGARDLEDGLINYESPFCGTRQFGLCWVSKDGAMAKIGTTLHIESHLRHGDGRLSVDNKGVERFKVLKVKEQKPVMICEVEVLPEDDQITPEVRLHLMQTNMVQDLASEVTRLFEGLLELNIKMGRVKRADILQKWVVDQDTLRPQVLDQLQPNELSYWIASIFAENPLHQQSLLQETSTVERLRQEKEVLSGTVSFLAAKHAVMDALSPKSEENPKEKPQEGAPPAGGPD